MSLSYQSLLTAVPVVLKAGNVPNIVGEAGIGKSALVNDIANVMQAKLFTTVVSLSEKGDLAIPVPPLTSDSFVQTKHFGQLADVQFGYSHTLVSIITYAEAHPAQPIIWLLDEFNRGTQAVQSELMNLVLQREINALKLPDQVHIIIAENPDATMAGFEDSSYGVTAGDAAIKDRTVRLVMRAEPKDWLHWAKQMTDGQANIHPLVQAYIMEEPDMLFPSQHGDDLYPTPRAWQRVSTHLYQLDQLPTEQRQVIELDILQGDLGQTVGFAFENFLKSQADELTPEQLFTDEQSQTVTDFGKLDEVQKQLLLQRAIAQTDQYPLNNNVNAAKFLQLLQTLSADGQFAIVQSIGAVEHQKDILEPMYAAIDEPTSAVAKLYQYFGQVATRNDTGDDD
jgi:hypothetical protein